MYQSLPAFVACPTQTETGWPIVANPMGIKKLEPKKGSSTVPMPGYDLRILDDEGHEVEKGALGNIVMRLPLPPGTFPTVWGDHQRKVDSYLKNFEGYYETGDFGYIDDDGKREKAYACKKEEKRRTDFCMVFVVPPIL